MIAKKSIKLIAYYVWILILSVYVVKEFPIDEIVDNVSKHYTILLFTCCAYIIWLFFELKSFSILTRNRVSKKYLLKVYLIGEAYNNFIPFVGFGGDPFRIYYLSKKLDYSLASKAVMQYRMTDILVAIITGTILITGVFIYNFELGVVWQKAFLSSLITYVIIIVLFLALFYHNFSDKIVNRLFRFFNKVKFNTTDYYFREILMTIGFQFLSRIFNVIELVLLLYAFGIPLEPENVILCYAFLSISTIFFFFIPNGIGVNEMGLAKGITLLGHSTASGIGIAFMRRARILIWAIIGLIIHFLDIIVGNHIRKRVIQK